MIITNVYVENFRGLTISIDNLEKSVLIFGKNDSGKTTLCKAILRVLDLNERRKRLEESDSTNCNRKDIIIKLVIDTTGLSDEHRSNIGKYLDNNLLHIKLISKFVEDINYYEDEMYYGNESKDFFPIDPNRVSPLDKVLSVIYIEPNYNLSNEKKTYFNYHDIKKIEDEKNFSDVVDKKIIELETSVSEEDIIQAMSKEINKFALDEEMFFQNISFKISPNIVLNNLLKSLDILPINEDGKSIDNIGDGKSKMLSMILHQKSFDDEKSKIVIAEEPENHLYPLLQVNYLSFLKKMEYSQLIVTSHSAKIINLTKLEQIIKLCRINGSVEINIFQYNKEYFAEFGELMTLELSEMLFYDNVLLVEGSSEKYFYDLLFLRDPLFQKKIIGSNTGIFSVSGIAFKKTKRMLESLGAKVFIKTDNDIFGVKGHRELKRYSGLLRAIEYLSDENKRRITRLLEIPNLDISHFTFNSSENCIISLELHLLEICEILFEERIIVSLHHEGFERDLTYYLRGKLNEDDYYYLKEYKLTNLHSILSERDIDISISSNDSLSPLVRFVDEL